MFKFLQAVKLIRLYQWNKNFFVFTGVIFAHHLDDTWYLQQAILTFFAFSLISSAVYIFNDYVDRESDRQHPSKKFRPLAAGTLSVNFAFMLLALFISLSILIAYFVSVTVLSLLLLYFIINLAYSLALKHIVILDVILIAFGFLLRLLAGTVGLAIDPSIWLIICGTAVALFLAFCKRKAELLALNKSKTSPSSPTTPKQVINSHRQVLKDYNPKLLNFLIFASAISTIISYTLYTLDPVTIQLHQTNKLIFTLPFVIYGIARYLVRIYRDSIGGDPSHDLFSDPHIIITVAAWIAVTISLIGG